MLSIKGANLTKILVNASILVLLVFVLVIVPLRLPDYYLAVLRDVLMWVALTISWNFFSGSTKYISLGSAAFFGIGLYFTAKTMALYPALPLPVIVLLAGLVNFPLALGIGLVTLRLRGIYFAILTFSVSMVASNLISWWEANVTGTKGTYVPVLFSTQAAYYTMLIGASVVILFTTLLRRSKFGLALKMIGESEEAAVHVGVNASIYRTLGFAMSAALMGFIGGCFVTVLPYINTDIAFDASYSFYPAVMTLLGGIGTVYGPMVGSIFLSLLMEYLSVILVKYFLITLGIILIVVVMLMPNGIMGVIEKIRTKTLSGSIKEIVEKIKTTKLFGSRRKARKKAAKAPEKLP